ncbi:kinase-associated lipoprotein KapB [Neobacillus sp. Marseille-QA0830]
MEDMQAGTIVTGIYKTGKYIGEITEVRLQHYLVRVLAVVKHPMQGDLHHPKEADVGFFHERRALSYREQANIPKQMVKPFDGDVPDYKQSLQNAVLKMKDELSGQLSEWSEKSLQSINSLEKDYFKE